MTLALDLTGRVALVTGSTRGIGWATARALARCGATVLVNGRSDEAQVKARADELARETGASTAPFFYDVSDADAVAAAFDRIWKTWKRLDALVHNTGIIKVVLLWLIAP